MGYRIGAEPVAGYRLEKLLGRGGFGEVWKSRGPGGISVALKIVNLSADSLGIKELRSLQRVKDVRHAHLVPIVGFWLKDELGNLLTEDEIESLVASGGHAMKLDELVIAMGLCDRTLVELLDERKKEGHPGIPRDELFRYLDNAARAIDYMNRPQHDLGSGPVGIQHCDIKPGNILLLGDTVQVCDFGLAQEINDRRTRRETSNPALTCAYAPPELLMGSSPSRHTDQYMLAITYCELRSGRLPFTDLSLGTITTAHLNGTLDLSSIDEREHAIIRRATARNPEQRFSSCVEFVTALTRTWQTTPGSGPSGNKVVSNPNLLCSGMDIGQGYRLIDRLGSGGYGEVWKATAPGGVYVAVKVIPHLERPEGQQEFRGLQLIKHLRHRNLLKLHSCWLLDKEGCVIPEEAWGKADGPQPAALLIASELATENLAQRLRYHQNRGEPGIPVNELIPYVDQAAKALDYLNDERHPDGSRLIGIVHRDVKPENILLIDDQVKLADFGLAKVLEGLSSAVHRRSAAFTLHFAAPEVLQNTVTRWTDQYSLAITYYYLRTGRMPFDGKISSPQGMLAVQVGTGLDFSRVSSGEQLILKRATTLSPEGRYATCHEMVKNLEKATRRALPSAGTSTPVFREPPVATSPFVEPGEESPGTVALSEVPANMDLEPFMPPSGPWPTPGNKNGAGATPPPNFGKTISSDTYDDAPSGFPTDVPDRPKGQVPTQRRRSWHDDGPNQAVIETSPMKAIPTPQYRPVRKSKALARRLLAVATVLCAGLGVGILVLIFWPGPRPDHVERPTTTTATTTTRVSDPEQKLREALVAAERFLGDGNHADASKEFEQANRLLTTSSTPSMRKRVLMGLLESQDGSAQWAGALATASQVGDLDQGETKLVPKEKARLHLWETRAKEALTPNPLALLDALEKQKVENHETELSQKERDWWKEQHGRLLGQLPTDAVATDVAYYERLRKLDPVAFDAKVRGRPGYPGVKPPVDYAELKTRLIGQVTNLHPQQFQGFLTELEKLPPQERGPVLLAAAYETSVANGITDDPKRTEFLNDTKDLAAEPNVAKAYVHYVRALAMQGANEAGPELARGFLADEKGSWLQTTGRQRRVLDFLEKAVKPRLRTSDVGTVLDFPFADAVSCKSVLESLRPARHYLAALPASPEGRHLELVLALAAWRHDPPETALASNLTGKLLADDEQSLTEFGTDALRLTFAQAIAGAADTSAERRTRSFLGHARLLRLLELNRKVDLSIKKRVDNILKPALALSTADLPPEGEAAAASLYADMAQVLRDYPGALDRTAKDKQRTANEVKGYFEQAARLAPNDPRYQVGLGLAALDALPPRPTSYDPIPACLDQVKGLADTSPRVLLLRGRLVLRQAKDQLEKDGSIQTRRDVCAAMKDALEDFRKGLKLCGQGTDALNDLAHLSESLGSAALYLVHLQNEDRREHIVEALEKLREAQETYDKLGHRPLDPTRVALARVNALEDLAWIVGELKTAGQTNDNYERARQLFDVRPLEGSLLPRVQLFKLRLIYRLVHYTSGDDRLLRDALREFNAEDEELSPAEQSEARLWRGRSFAHLGEWDKALAALGPIEERLDKKELSGHDVETIQFWLHLPVDQAIQVPDFDPLPHTIKRFALLEQKQRFDKFGMYYVACRAAALHQRTFHQDALLLLKDYVDRAQANDGGVLILACYLAALEKEQAYGDKLSAAAKAEWAKQRARRKGVAETLLKHLDQPYVIDPFVRAQGYGAAAIALAEELSKTATAAQRTPILRTVEHALDLTTPAANKLAADKEYWGPRLNEWLELEGTQALKAWEETKNQTYRDRAVQRFVNHDSVVQKQPRLSDLLSKLRK